MLKIVGKKYLHFYAEKVCLLSKPVHTSKLKYVDENSDQNQDLPLLLHIY